MKIKNKITIGDQHLFDKVGNHLGWRALWIARKCAVQVPLIDRRGSRAGDGCGGICHRQDDQATTYVLGLQFPAQVAQGNLALIFITVVASNKQSSWPGAIADGDNRNKDVAIGASVNRMRQMQIAGLFAGGIKVDV